MESPWLVRGDFNVILSEEEKYGGLPVYVREVEDFAHCVDTCELYDLGFKGSLYTWWNGRSDIDCILFFLNQQFLDLFPALEVEHLIKYGLDHAPLLLSCNIDTVQVKKLFKFLNFWAKHETFLDVVKENWVTDGMGNPFILFQNKLKKVKATLTVWSKETFGDIFKKIASLEDVIKVHKVEFELNPTIQNRAKLHKVEANLTSDEQNERLWAEPTMEEVKVAVFGLNGNSVSGPVRFTGQFYHASWEIICDNVLNMVKAFYYGAELPKFITHTNLVLLPKKKNVATFSNMRPISLSNFSNKIISRVVLERLRGKPSNVVIKLDMAKAYDRVLWLFLTKTNGFYKSSREVKLGDPLSPTLFILEAEVLGRALDAIFDNPDFIGFGPDHWCDESIKYVEDVVENGTWNEVLLRELLPEELADHILEITTPPLDHSIKDKPTWNLENKWPIYCEVYLAIHKEEKRGENALQVLLGTWTAFQDNFLHVEVVKRKAAFR
ncbi:uncharacterized protein LOC142165134 [Nicotiana tabacum]|uniref:Uncharacterized protein LOC142165134 n=1 Tax=Nicotiana tabacum TaxID=4097 RepID=A0AC58S4I9_TOBAC